MTEYKLDIRVNADALHVTRSIVYVDSFKYLKYCLADLLSEDDLDCSISVYKIENGKEFPMSLSDLI